ncbi:MAG TPA: sigma-54 dependent transcriptional regulator [Gammaproteobacteria bacterium]|nr:sigma-54 dependent transcriptional regulator [Gammaproteobacteria bacterium]
MPDRVILVVEDDPSLREALSQTLELAGYSVLTACDGRSALDVLSDNPVAMVISDVQMKPMDGHALLRHIKVRYPELPILLMTAYGTIQKAVESMHAGAVDYIVKPFEADALVGLVNRYIPPVEEPSEMIAVDERTQGVMELARRVADTDSTIMITGESGAGKEVLARYLHNQSRRSEQPFVAINCAAIPDNMLEATLFGYEKGAFTGAYSACPGKFEQAQGGVLLLDEISEMNLGLQAKLLRVLQEREVERLGGRKTIELDVRVFATSNRVLREEVAEGRFREDLFYRLNVFPLHLPPLRERRGDILPLATRLLRRHAQTWGRVIPRLTEAAQSRLMGHDWPGNVRELDNVVQRALILQRGEEITEHDLNFETISGVARQACVPEPAPATDQKAPAELGHGLKNHEQKLILEALKAGMGSRKAAAERLGISQRTLRYKLARMREAGVSIPRSLRMEGI